VVDAEGSLDEILKACAESGAAFKADPYNSDSVHCPFYKRFGVAIFGYYEKNPQYAGRFAKGMAGWAKSECLSTSFQNHRDVFGVKIISPER
jgi:hypothetical protein